MTSWVTPEFVEIDMSAEIGAYQQELVSSEHEGAARSQPDNDEQSQPG